MTFMKSFISLAFLAFVSTSSFAFCVPMNGEYKNPISGFVENSPRHMDTTRGCWVPDGIPPLNQTQPGWGQVIANQTVRIPVGSQIPQGQCTWTERLQNILLSGGIGAVMGTLVGDNGRATGNGAAAGMAVGMTISCEAKQQFLRAHGYGNDRELMGERYQSGNTVRLPSNCNVGGKDFGEMSDASCTKVRESLTVRSQEVVQTTAVPQEQPSATGCGVKLGGALIKELPPREGSTCANDKKVFIEHFMQKCRGKGGSDAADIQCGRRIEI